MVLLSQTGRSDGEVNGAVVIDRQPIPERQHVEQRQQKAETGDQQGPRAITQVLEVLASEYGCQHR